MAHQNGAAVTATTFDAAVIGVSPEKKAERRPPCSHRCNLAAVRAQAGSVRSACTACVLLNAFTIFCSLNNTGSAHAALWLGGSQVTFVSIQQLDLSTIDEGTAACAAICANKAVTAGGAMPLIQLSLTIHHRTLCYSGSWPGGSSLFCYSMLDPVARQRRRNHRRH